MSGKTPSRCDIGSAAIEPVEINVTRTETVANAPRRDTALVVAAAEPTITCERDVVDQPTSGVNFARPQSIACAHHEDATIGPKHAIDLALQRRQRFCIDVFEHTGADDQVERGVGIWQSPTILGSN